MTKLPFTLTLIDVETQRILAERFETGEPRPDWATSNPDVGGIQVLVGEGEDDSMIDVTYSNVFTDDELAIAILVVARYRAEKDQSPVENLADEVRKLPEGSASAIALDGMKNLVPYVREIVQSSSVRLNPGNPVVLPPFRNEFVVETK